MQNSFKSNVNVLALSLLCLVPCSVVATTDPLKNKTFETVENGVVTGLHKHNAHEIEPGTRDSFKKIAAALTQFCDTKNTDPLAKHLAQLHDGLVSLKADVVALEKKIETSTDAHQKKGLESLHVLLKAFCCRLEAVYVILRDYKGSTNLIDLIGLGLQVNAHRSLLPRDQRVITDFGWKKILEIRVQYR